MNTINSKGLLLQETFDSLCVQVYASRLAMGEAAGKDVSLRIAELLQQQDVVRIIFAAAPSQLELLAYLACNDTIEWPRVDVFHMDEYTGLPADAPQRFSSFLMGHLFKKVKPRNVYLIDDRNGAEAACNAYERLITEAPVDIVCLGIGENGHIAFNDPPVADFHDAEIVKPVLLDEACRQQQVNDGCFPSLNAVPRQALTLTIPALLSGRYLYCVVPGESKSTAIRNVLHGNISTAWPASVLRTHVSCTLYTDTDAYSQLL